VVGKEIRKLGHRIIRQLECQAQLPSFPIA
jgi:hypothetical protein